MKQTLEVEQFLLESANGIILDVRTPAEFEKGHIPGAKNLPLFTNEERVVVGTLYVQVGKEQAVEKGLEFVGTRLAQLVKDAKKLSQGKTIYLHCWRGGMRSGSVAWLLRTAGLNVVLLKGGYKAFRSHFDSMLTLRWKFVMLGGSTGSGKSEILAHLKEYGEQIIDLEGLANHKGSAFGALGQEKQPTTEHFINLLHVYMMGLDPTRRVWCESESMLVGHVFLPQEFFSIMKAAPQVEIVMPVEQRLTRLEKEYGCFSKEDLIAAFSKIRKRLGFDQTKDAIEFLEQGKIREAAAIALKYYDKAYQMSSAKNEREWRKTFEVENDKLKENTQKLIQTI